MTIELRFDKEDLETMNWIKCELGASEDDFFEVRSFEGSLIVLAIYVLINQLIKNPDFIDSFLNRKDTEVHFDEQGRLLQAKGYSIKDVIKLKSIESEKPNELEEEEA